MANTSSVVADGEFFDADVAGVECTLDIGQFDSATGIALFTLTCGTDVATGDATLGTLTLTIRLVVSGPGFAVGQVIELEVQVDLGTGSE